MTSELFDIAGKKAVVTGGGSGIGTMIAAGFVEAGVSVIIAAYSTLAGEPPGL